LARSDKPKRAKSSMLKLFIFTLNASAERRVPLQDVHVKLRAKRKMFGLRSRFKISFITGKIPL